MQIDTMFMYTTQPVMDKVLPCYNAGIGMHGYHSMQNTLQPWEISAVGHIAKLRSDFHAQNFKNKIIT